MEQKKPIRFSPNKKEVLKPSHKKIICKQRFIAMRVRPYYRQKPHSLSNQIVKF